jgi:hypothetical protein
MNYYHIIDEPKIKKSENLIMSPIIILFVAIFLPVFWNPPFMGRWWIPFLWLAFNGYLLGSPTLKKEIAISVIGILSLFGLLELFIYISEIEPFNQLKSLAQYVRIILNGVFFFILYIVVFKQTVPYDIYTYMRER